MKNIGLTVNGYLTTLAHDVPKNSWTFRTNTLQLFEIDSKLLREGKKGRERDHENDTNSHHNRSTCVRGMKSGSAGIRDITSANIIPYEKTSACSNTDTQVT